MWGLLVATHVMANVVWIGAIASVGWLVRRAADPSLEETERKTLGQAAYRLLYQRAAAPAIAASLKARLAGQIGDLLQVVGRFQLTGEWYSVARKLARAAHDHPLVAAIEYNRLAVGLTRYRYDEILNQFRSNAIDRKWEIEYESVKNLQIGFRNEALTDLLEVCDARYKHVCGQNGGAAEILRALRARGAVALSGSSAMAFDAEIAWYDALAGRSCSDLSEMIRVLDGVESSDISENIDLVFFVRELMHLAGVFERKPLIYSLMRPAS